MNQSQRKHIYTLIAALEAVEPTDYAAATDALSDVLGEVESIRDDEQDKYDNMPESLQSGSKGDAIQDAISSLEDAARELEEAKGALTERNEENQKKDHH